MGGVFSKTLLDKDKIRDVSSDYQCTNIFSACRSLAGLSELSHWKPSCHFRFIARYSSEHLSTCGIGALRFADWVVYWLAAVIASLSATPDGRWGCQVAGHGWCICGVAGRYGYLFICHDLRRPASNGGCLASLRIEQAIV